MVASGIDTAHLEESYLCTFCELRTFSFRKVLNSICYWKPTRRSFLALSFISSLLRALPFESDLSFNTLFLSLLLIKEVFPTLLTYVASTIFYSLSTGVVLSTLLSEELLLLRESSSAFSLMIFLLWNFRDFSTIVPRFK